MTIIHVVGTRPNLVKAAPVIRALSFHKGLRQIIIHTGQHYDFSMFDTFLEQLDMPTPDYCLQCKTKQQPKIFVNQVSEKTEAIVRKIKTDCAVVYGDVHSTLGAALAFEKMKIPIAHVESGLRSFDTSMPEEGIRIKVDHLSALLFTTAIAANENLLAEGIAANAIHFLGNTMIDSLMRFLPLAQLEKPWNSIGLTPCKYFLVTLHRPSNVDDSNALRNIINNLNSLAEKFPIVFPVHPRTRKMLDAIEIKVNDAVLTLPPLPYLSFLGLMANACAVITDSGGVQEETSWLNIPCITLREQTERPVTLTLGTNVLVGANGENLKQMASNAWDGIWKSCAKIEHWDGKAGERIAYCLVERLSELRTA